MMTYPTITLEEHFISSNAIAALPTSHRQIVTSANSEWLNRLTDFSPDGSRIMAMDSGHVGVQVLSITCGITSLAPEVVADANNELAKATEAQPRFKGFAALPMKYGKAAADELERCIKQLGMVGALIDSHLDDGRYYDDEVALDVFAKAQELDVPIYIHPTTPLQGVQAALYDGNYDKEVAAALGIAGWGWHCDTALSVLRLYTAGIFWKFPNLKVVVGHMGEMLPYMLDRIDEKVGQMWLGAKMSFKEVWEKNIWVTTSGMFTMPPMACLLRNTSIDRIMYSVDYPYSTTEQGKTFMRELQESGLVTEEEYCKIAFKNAEKLLKFSL
jgi:predicted TIM-barrel fold metal-dependent hydrolase